jgi:hypothetical protein
MSIDCTDTKLFIVPILAYLVIAMAPAACADGLPDFLYSKGGIIYPHTGDSTQEIFRTPPNVKDFIKPGMLIGVLPEDCISASRGTIGDYYICNYELALKPEERYGKTVYRVIEAN